MKASDDKKPKNFVCSFFGHKFTKIFNNDKVEILNSIYAKYKFKKVCERCGYSEEGILVSYI